MLLGLKFRSDIKKVHEVGGKAAPEKRAAVCWYVGGDSEIILLIKQGKKQFLLVLTARRYYRIWQ